MKTALITGASSGIGLAFTKLLAKEKYNLILVARTKKVLTNIKKDLESKHHITITPIQKDLAKPNAAQELYKTITKKKLHIDILINNAGIGAYGRFSKTDWKQEEQMIQLNITALTHLTKLFIPDMLRRKKGKILQVASTAAFQPGPLMSVYYATKAFVLSFSEAIAEEIKGSGVTITTLCPGPTKSNFQKNANIGKVKLFSGNVATSMDVAKYGLAALKRGQVVAVHGPINKLLKTSIRFLPRNMVRTTVHNMQKTTR